MKYKSKTIFEASFIKNGIIFIHKTHNSTNQNIFCIFLDGIIVLVFFSLKAYFPEHKCSPSDSESANERESSCGRVYCH